VVEVDACLIFFSKIQKFDFSINMNSQELQRGLSLSVSNSASKKHVVGGKAYLIFYFFSKKCKKNYFCMHCQLTAEN